MTFTPSHFTHLHTHSQSLSTLIFTSTLTHNMNNIYTVHDRHCYHFSYNQRPICSVLGKMTDADKFQTIVNLQNFGTDLTNIRIRINLKISEFCHISAKHVNAECESACYIKSICLYVCLNLSNLAKFSATRSVARPLCSSLELLVYTEFYMTVLRDQSDQGL